MGDYVSTSMGRLGFALPTPYIETSVYKTRDTVQYQGNTYVVLRDGVQGVVPADDGVSYRLLCARGNDGAGNTKWHTGTAVTGTGTGIVASVPGSSAGDMYLNSETGDIYQALAADTWNFVLNTIGPEPEVTAETVPAKAPDGEGSTVQVELDRLEGKEGKDIPAKPPGGSSGSSTVQAELDAINALRNSPLKNAIRDLIYPVTSIVTFDGDIDPNEHWGGTWERWGNGRVVVGVDEDDEAFAVSGKTGGAKLVSHAHDLTIHSGGGGISGGTAITVAQMPSHTHPFSLRIIAGSDNTIYAYTALGPAGVNGANSGPTGASGSGAAHTHSTPNHAHTGTMGSTDISTLQPYITAKRWKRTA